MNLVLVFLVLCFCGILLHAFGAVNITKKMRKRERKRERNRRTGYGLDYNLISVVHKFSWQVKKKLGFERTFRIYLLLLLLEEKRRNENGKEEKKTDFFVLLNKFPFESFDDGKERETI